MSSSPLYLAIVVVWAIVLVPMLLRRDAADPAADSLFRTAPRSADGEEYADAEDFDEFDTSADPSDTTDPVEDLRADTPPDMGDADEGGTETEVDGPAEDVDPVPERAPAVPVVSRARVIARRRRRTSGLSALLIATAVAVGMGLGPWWVLAPPTVLLFGHLALLREAAKADTERRGAEREYRRRRAAHLRHRAAEAEAAAAREAEILEFTARRDQVYDQNADAHLRAVGD